MIDYKNVVLEELDRLVKREDYYLDNEPLDCSDKDTLSRISGEIALLQKILHKMITQENAAYEKMLLEQGDEGGE